MTNRRRMVTISGLGLAAMAAIGLSRGETGWAQERPAAPGVVLVRQARRVPPFFGQIGITPQQREEIYAIRADFDARISELERQLQELKAREALWFRRERIPVEPARINQALGEFLQTCRDIERRHTKFVPRTYNYTCPRNCDYHELCVAEFQGLDIAPLIKLHYQVESERYGEDSNQEDLLAA